VDLDEYVNLDHMPEVDDPDDHEEIEQMKDDLKGMLDAAFHVLDDVNVEGGGRTQAVQWTFQKAEAHSLNRFLKGFAIVLAIILIVLGVLTYRSGFEWVEGKELSGLNNDKKRLETQITELEGKIEHATENPDEAIREEIGEIEVKIDETRTKLEDVKTKVPPKDEAKLEELKTQVQNDRAEVDALKKTDEIRKRIDPDLYACSQEKRGYWRSALMTLTGLGAIGAGYGAFAELGASAPRGAVAGPVLVAAVVLIAMFMIFCIERWWHNCILSNCACCKKS